jgi:hypothetical protein
MSCPHQCGPFCCRQCHAEYGGGGSRKVRSSARRRLSFWEVVNWMKKPVVAASGPVSAVDHLDSTFRTKMPSLHEFLTQETWEDGSRRETGTFFMFSSGLAWKAMLKCRASKRVAFVSGASLAELLSSLDAGLAADTLDWRPDSVRPQGRGR